MTQPLPATISTCLITAHVVQAVIDSPADEDRDPDLAPLAGAHVTITASASHARHTGEPPMLVTLAAITRTLDDDGILRDSSGGVGVRVVASDDPDLQPSGWTYTARISHPSITPITATFAAPSGGVIDLSAVVSVPPSSGDPVQAIVVPAGATPGQVLTWTVEGRLDWGTGAEIDPETIEQAVTDWLADHPVESITEVVVVPLASGAEPTGEVSGGVLTLGIPAGAPGADGDPGSPGADGADGREIELRVSGGWIQWRYTDATWTNLIALTDLTGPPGADGTDGTDGDPLAPVSFPAATGTAGAWTIVDDGSSTTGWPNRWSVWFDPQSGADVEVFALNEYGEDRHQPAKPNTVASRWFSGPNSAAYAARDKSVPLIEVMDDRTTRTHKAGIYPDGDADFAKDVTVGGDLSATGLLLDGRRITAGPTPPASPSPGDIHILTEV